MDMPNGVNVTYTFDDAKRLTKIENIGGSNIYTAEYRLDKIGQKVRIDESGTNRARTLKYTYDNVYRLMSEYDSLGTGTTTSYAYDDVGNRVSKDVNGTAYTYTVDQLNRVTAVSDGSTIAWTYDANGNTATKTTGGVTNTYSYDRENRLVDVSTTSGSIFNAVYDYRSRRLEKTENSSTVKYLYDGGVSVLEYDGQGSLTKVLVRGSGYGSGIGSVIYTADDVNGTNRRFFLYNALGSTSAMTNDSMTVTSPSSYDGWGKEISSTGSNETDRKFCTKERSASIGLDYFGFRYYDYDLGRFTTRDPSGYPDGLNNYLYCSNDPVNKIDPLGLKKKKSDFEKHGDYMYHKDDWKHLSRYSRLIKKTKNQKIVDVLKEKRDDLAKRVEAYQVPTFEGFTDKHYQKHDELIMKAVRDFNNDIKAGIGGTDEQVKQVKKAGYLRASIVKSQMIQENGADPEGKHWRQKKAVRFWNKDPLTVNHAGKDWSPAKAMLGLKENKNGNEYPSGNLKANMIAGIRFLARKGFRPTGSPANYHGPGDTHKYTFDGWKSALNRYGPGRPNYAPRIMDRANNPNTHVPITGKYTTP
jgi:RHS repeat-associated protein